MKHGLTLKLLHKIDRHSYFNIIQLKEISYSIQAIVSDGSKFILLWIFFRLLNLDQEYFYSFIMTTLLRIFIGGLHFKHYSSCLCFSGIYYFLLIRSRQILSFKTASFLFLVSTLIIMVLSPQSPRSSKRYCRLKTKTIKMISFVIILVYFILYVVSKNPLHFMGLLTIIFQSLQLVIMKGGNYLCRSPAAIHYHKKFY